MTARTFRITQTSMIARSMIRVLPLLLAVLCTALIHAPEASANGILIAERDGRIPTPRPRRPHVRPRPPVTLKGHKVEATVRDQVAEVTVEQVFHNHSGRQLEGTYIFPLPEGASVSRFAMTMGGKMVEGEIIEADKARRIYQSIVSRRRDPGLLEYMGRGLFRARVFPIMPKSDLTIRLTFQQVLEDNAGTLEFRYPLATDRLNATPVPSVLVDIKVESSIDLKALYTPSHQVEINRDGERKARITYERQGKKQDRDLLLYIGRSPDEVGFSMLSHRAIGEDGTFMAVFAPRTEVKAADRAPKDVVYVFDTSGSMLEQGKIKQAKKALRYGVSTLGPNDRFNIIGFATGLTPFRDKLLPASEEAKAAALKWIDSLEARGGTNIEGALTEALEHGSDDRLFMVVFLTDGRPTIGERQTGPLLKKVAAANKDKARIFTFGVGFDLEVRLLDKIAQASGGARDYVMPDEDIEIVTGRFFRKVEQPVLADIEIAFGSGVHDVYPQKIPALFAGEQVVVFGRYKESGDRVIKLTGKIGDKAVTHEYEGTLRRGEDAAFLPRLWAHRKVAFLLDQIRLNGQSKELVEEVIRLATKHAIVTPYTAGLVVEEGEMENMVDMPAGRRRFERLGRADRGGRMGGGGGIPVPTPDALGPRTPGAPPRTGGADPADARPAAEAAASKKLRDLRKADNEEADDKDGLDEVRARIQRVAGKAFLLRADGRWVQSGLDLDKQKTTQVEAYSEAWFALMKKGDEVAKILAIGEKLVFEHGGTLYEVVAPRK